MSHFAEMSVLFDQKNESALVAALEKEFGEGSVEVHETPVEVMTWQNLPASKQSKDNGTYAPHCHVIVRHETLAKKAGRRVLSNDAGYLRTTDGKYKAFIDAAGFDQEQQGRVSQEYAAIVSEKQLRSKGYTVKRQQLDGGRIQLHATKY